MAPSTSMAGRLAFFGLTLAALFSPAAAIEQRYCSTMNTADDIQGTPSIYQTTGLCRDQCVGKYAFAVLQGNLCWCSNYVPGTTVDRSECNTPCPAYPEEQCGGEDDDLYGYIKLNLQPSGTKGTPSSTSSEKPEATTVTAPGTTVIVTPSSSTPSTTSSSSSSDSSTSTSESSTKTSSSESSTTTSQDSVTSSSQTWSATPVTSQVTITGQLQTIVVTPTSPPEDVNKDQDSSSGGSGGLGTGQAVGLAIGLFALVAIIAILIFFFLRKKRKERDEEILRSNVSSTAPTPARTMSESSRYMLGTDGRNVVEGWQAGDNAPGNRRSRLMPVDPRLDPFAPVYQRGDGNRSRESVQTIQDNCDYSRRVHQTPTILRAVNPDT